MGGGSGDGGNGSVGGGSGGIASGFGCGPGHGSGIFGTTTRQIMPGPAANHKPPTVTADRDIARTIPSRVAAHDRVRPAPRTDASRRGRSPASSVLAAG